MMCWGTVDVTEGLTTTMLMIRHGQSEWNAEGRWQGQLDPDLSELGQEQARVAARSVGDIDAIVASPLARAFQTASIIGAHLGVGPVEAFDGLMERCLGEWQGLTRTQIDEGWPGWVEDETRRPPGWELEDDLFDRVSKALTMVAEKYPGGHVLVAAHSGVIISVEKHLGVFDGRIPNLHGRIVRFHHNRPAKPLSPGDPVALVPEDMRSGGSSSNRSY